MSERSDANLVKLVLAGEIDLFADLMTRYETKLLRYVQTFLRDEDGAKDVVQETFIKTYQNLNNFNPKYKFSSWIYRIAHNEAISALRRHKPTVALEDATSFPELQNNLLADELIDQAILRQSLKKCLYQLEAKYREVLILRYFENLSYDEMADILQIPPSTVGVRLGRAKIKMRQICHNEKEKI